MFNRKKKREMEALKAEMDEFLEQLDLPLMQLCSSIAEVGHITSTVESEEGSHFTIELTSRDGRKAMCVISISQPMETTNTKPVGFTANMDKHHHGYL